MPLLARALADAQRGLGAWGVAAEPGALRALAALADGDARRALGLLEQAAAMARAQGAPLTQALAEQAAGAQALLYDRDGDQHYDLISALHKCVRASLPDGAVYWCTRMLAAGEDPLYVLRRLTRMASEDIGNADPGALGLALSAREAYQFLGHPEGEVAIIQLAAYLACVPKSDASERAYNEARAEVAETGARPVPLHLRNAPTKLMKDLDYGKGYRYAHDEEGKVADMDCLPDSLRGRSYYQPTQEGREKQLAARMAEVRRIRAGKRGGAC